MVSVRPQGAKLLLGLYVDDIAWPWSFKFRRRNVTIQKGLKYNLHLAGFAFERLYILNLVAFMERAFVPRVIDP